MTRIIADIETDGLKPSVIHLVGILDLDTLEYTSYQGDEIVVGLTLMAEAELLVGHNLLGFDLPVIENLTDGLIQFDRARVVDTLMLGRKLLPDMKSQSLEEWGAVLGLPKLPSPIFERFTPEMLPYCQRDCELSKMVFDFLWELLIASEA